ncbi:hypothetical protein JCM8202_005285 [Rhodotorula sphaerocarpa]
MRVVTLPHVPHLALLLSLLLGAAAVVWLVSRLSASQKPIPRSRDTDDTQDERCLTPGPALAVRVARLDLDGFTSVPLARLPRLSTGPLPLPFLAARTLAFHLDLTASEVVCRQLRVGHATVTSRDVGREPIQVAAQDVEVDLSASVGARVVVTVAKEGGTGASPTWTRSWRLSGRIRLALTGASPSISARLLSRRRRDSEASDSELGLGCDAIDFEPGHVSILTLTDFLPVGSRLLEAVAHRCRNTAVARYLTRQLTAFLVRDAVQGPVCTELLEDLSAFVRKHVDVAPWAGLTDTERDKVYSPIAQGTPTSTSLRFHASVFGPVHLHSFSLPTAADAAAADATDPSLRARGTPVFARSDRTGLRHALLSSPLVNQLTRGPPELSLGPAAFDRVEFREVHLELEPDPHELLEGDGEGGAVGGRDSNPEEDDAAATPTPTSTRRRPPRPRDLVVRIGGLAATLSLRFRLGADLRAAPALVSGVRVLEERGSAVMEVAEAARAGAAGAGARTAAGRRSADGLGRDEFVDDDDEEEGETPPCDGGGGEGLPGGGIAIRLPLWLDRTSGRVHLASRHDDPDPAGVAPLLDPALEGPQPPPPPPPPPNGSWRREWNRDRGIRLEGAFGTVSPRIRLESRLGKFLGERVVNSLFEAVETHLAALTVPLASHFLADLARERLQRALDDVTERLATEGGILWTAAAAEPVKLSSIPATAGPAGTASLPDGNGATRARAGAR